MHGAAFAVAVASGFAEQFGHHEVGQSAFGKAVAVAAVGGGDEVGRFEGLAGADGYGLLADAGVDVAGHAPLGEELGRLEVELTDALHLPVVAQEVVAAVSFRFHTMHHPRWTESRDRRRNRRPGWPGFRRGPREGVGRRISGKAAEPPGRSCRG